MPNYSREQQKDDSTNLLGILAVGAALVVGSVGSHMKKKSLRMENEQLHMKYEQLRSRINEIDGQIREYKNRFLGEFIYSSEIEKLESERKVQMSNLDSIAEQLNESI